MNTWWDEMANHVAENPDKSPAYAFVKCRRQHEKEIKDMVKLDDVLKIVNKHRPCMKEHEYANMNNRCAEDIFNEIKALSNQSQQPVKLADKQGSTTSSKYFKRLGNPVLCKCGHSEINHNKRNKVCKRCGIWICNKFERAVNN